MRQAKLDRIVIMSLNFDGLLKTGPGAPPDAKRTLDIMDLPQMMADRYGVRRIELQHSHFLSTDDAYLKEFRDRVAKAKSQLTQINLEFGAGQTVSAAGFSGRNQAIDLAKVWIDHAATLGCQRVMVNQGPLNAEVRQTAVAALKIIGDYGRERKVTVTMENRDTGEMPAAPPPPPAPPAGAPAAGGRGGGQGRAGGPPLPPATWQVVVDTIKAAGIAANPDIGNFPNEQERAAGLKVLYTMTAGSSHAHYDPSKYNFANAIKVSKEAGYKGLYAVETGPNNGADPHAATKMILDELVKLI